MNDENEVMDIEEALKRAFSLGQTYWHQADSESLSMQAKSLRTLDKFNDLKAKIISERSK